MNLKDSLSSVETRALDGLLSDLTPEYLTPAEAAEVVGIQETVILQWMKNGLIRVYLEENGQCVSWIEVQARRELFQEEALRHRIKDSNSGDKRHTMSVKQQDTCATTKRKRRKRKRNRKREEEVKVPFVKRVKSPKKITIVPGGAVSGPKDREQLVLVSMEQRLAVLNRKTNLTLDETRERVRLTAQIGEYRILIARRTPPS